MKEKINVEFNLSVNDGTQTSFETNGTIEEFKELTRICFLEISEIKALTTVDIYKDKVTIKRNGAIKMYMEYILGVTTMVSLDTEFHYHIDMESYTQELIISDNYIYVKYQTETDKEQNLYHVLDLKWQKIN